MKVLKRIVMALLIIDLIVRFSVGTAEAIRVARVYYRIEKLKRRLRDKKWFNASVEEARAFRKREEQIDSMALRFWMELGPDTVAGESQPEEVRTKASAELHHYFHIFVRMLDGRSELRNMSTKTPMKQKLALEEKVETLVEAVYHQSFTLTDYGLETSIINEWIENALKTEHSQEPSETIHP